MTHHLTLAIAALQVTTSPWAGPLFMYGAIFLIFYVILIRPQQRQRKQHEELIASLKRGDEVVTNGGLVGEVVHIKESTKDGAAVRTPEDRVTIKSGESRVVVERGRIARVIASGAATGAAKSGT